MTTFSQHPEILQKEHACCDQPTTPIHEGPGRIVAQDRPTFHPAFSSSGASWPVFSSAAYVIEWHAVSTDKQKPNRDKMFFVWNGDKFVVPATPPQ